MNSIIDLISSYFRYNTHGLLNLAAGFCSLSLGIVVLSQQPKSRLNQAYLWLTITTSIWTVSFGMISLTRRIEDARFWMSASYTGGVPFISVAFFAFSSLLANPSRNYKKLTTVGVLSGLLIMLPITLVNEKICPIREFSWGRYNHYVVNTWTAIYAVLVLAHFFFFAVLTIRNYWLGLKSTQSPQERFYFKTSLISAAIAYTGSLDFLRTFHFSIYPFGYASLTIFLAINAYIILRHQFMTTNIAVRKFTVIFVIYSFLLGFSFPVLLLLVKQLLAVGTAEMMSPVFIFVLLIAFILSLGPAVYSFLVNHTFWLRNNESAGLVHELKSPIASIQAAVEFMRKNNSSRALSEHQRQEYLEMIDRNSQRLELFVDDLLNLVQIQDDTVTLKKAACDLSELISSGVNNFAAIISSKGLTLKVDVPSSASIFADAKKIQQVISNLISNAIKYSPQGTISITLTPNASHYLCEIRDEGLGISRENMKKVFDRFFQVSKSSKGAGVGLAIAKAWVEAHGGKIWAESEGEGKGTTVTFTLPT